MIRDIKQRASAYISLLKAQRHGRQVPLVSNLFFLTGVCNSNCAYCYVDMKSKPEREYDLDGWLKLIDDLVERGTKIFSLVGGASLFSLRMCGRLLIISTVRIYSSPLHLTAILSERIWIL